MTEGSLTVRHETWSGGNTRIARVMARPMVKFLAQETASGVLLLVATAAALLWANGFWVSEALGESYHEFWDTPLSLTVASTELLDLTLHQWVNDALMALFFFVVGMEIKSELVNGDLADFKVATLPAVAALGGMVVPALFFVVFNFGSDTLSGWGVPMATDIAFAVGVLALLGPRVPQRLKLFLLTLAIVDDIGAIVVIAVFYTSDLDFFWLGVAAGLVAVVVILTRFRVWYSPIYAIIGTGVWFATHESGVHATIAGVLLGLLTPAAPLLAIRAFEQVEDILSGETADPVSLRNANWRIRESQPVTARLTNLMSPWTSFFVIPLFALSNAGVKLTGDALGGALTSTVTWGIIAGLVVGKPIGIYVFSMVAIRAGWARLPAGLGSNHLLGAGAVAGIGFTVALFIANLAFVSDEVIEQAVIGILAASLVATLVGWVVLRSVEPEQASAPEPMRTSIDV
ncbi:MAG: Na+/H+ antiporter NhaA [Actinomycetia bacterium]|nr:Na+/H+ antiporter NhaA [Actinomycetes bacterium]MCP4223162.1 Na+/H+ antiporter NhaA [Actinomycetes bacterium]MCP5030521.1 Na+/H+ antiporter NhaA [Actinomycetes bacterium]